MAENQEQFFSFEEALDQLRLKEEELKRLVSEGEIRAFRDGDDMRLRRTDVEQLRVELGEEIVFEDEDFVEPGMATEEISEADTLIDELEDVGELEEVMELESLEADLDDVEEEPVAPVEPVEEPYEGGGVRALLVVASLLMVLTLPLLVAICTGKFGGMAKGVAGLFVEDMRS